MLPDGGGELEYRLFGGRFGRDRPMLRLQVVGVLNVRCQHCLGEMKYPVDISKDFVMVADESAIPEDEFDDDEADYLVADRKLNVAALVEEEILLSLPLVLRHESGCSGEPVPASTGKPNPFQVLEGLRKKSQQV